MSKGNRQIGQNLDGQTHRSGAGCGFGWRRKNGFIGGVRKKEILVRTRTDRLTGAEQDAVLVSVERTYCWEDGVKYLFMRPGH